MKRVEQGLCLILVVAIIMSGFVGLNISQTTEERELIFGENMTRGGSNYYEAARGITEHDGFLYITGAVGDDFLLLKFDTDGNLIWGRTWGSIDDREIGVDLIGYNGYLYVICRLDDHGPAHDINIDIVLLKYDTNGDLLWNITWSGKESNGYASDFAREIYLHDDSLYIVGSTNHTPLLIKFDTDGNELWNKTWKGDLYPCGQCSGITTHNENLFIIGEMNTYTWPDENYVFLLNYDVDGNLIWNKTWDDGDLYFGNGTVAPLGIVRLDNRLYITVGPLVCEDRIGLILVYDTDGQLASIKTFGGSEFRGIGPTIEYNGNLYISGTNQYGIFLREFDENGNQSWNITWGENYDYSVCGMVAYDNFLYLAGGDSSGVGSDVLLLKYDEDGNLIWNLTWGRTGIENNSTQPVAINISMAKQQLSHPEPINVTVTIINYGTENISRSGYCFTFVLEHNGASMELFCPYNTTVAIIPPVGGVFVQTVDLREYSSDLDTWGEIGNLNVGNYSLRAVYGSQNNPWYNETEIPYNETTSNTLQFEITPYGYKIELWVILTVFVGICIVFISYRVIKKRKTQEHNHHQRNEGKINEN